MNVVSMDTVSMGMVSTDKNLNTLLCVCEIVSLQVCVRVCAEWYPQTNTVAFISAPLSGPAFTRADLQDTDSPQMEKPAAAGTGSPEAAVVRSSLHSRTGTTVRD